MIVPSSFYASSVAKDRKMDLATLSQAFNANGAELKQLLTAAAIALGKRACLGSTSRSNATNASRSEAVIAAIHSIPFLSLFFERHLKRYKTFVGSLVASVARLCDEEFKQWQAKRREETDIIDDDAEALPR